jgi:hypothetical protein
MIPPREAPSTIPSRMTGFQVFLLTAYLRLAKYLKPLLNPAAVAAAQRKGWTARARVTFVICSTCRILRLILRRLGRIGRV